MTLQEIRDVIGDYPCTANSVVASPLPLRLLSAFEALVEEVQRLKAETLKTQTDPDRVHASVMRNKAAVRQKEVQAMNGLNIPIPTREGVTNLPARARFFSEELAASLKDLVDLYRGGYLRGADMAVDRAMQEAAQLLHDIGAEGY